MKLWRSNFLSANGGMVVQRARDVGALACTR